jgi:hypothetical protein
VESRPPDLHGFPTGRRGGTSAPPLAAGTRTIQPKIRKDLNGFDYRFNTRGISRRPTFIKWIEETMRHSLEKPPTEKAISR